MDEWCTKTHNESGLVKKIQASTYSKEEAEHEVMKFLLDECGLKSFTCPIAGNSVHEDKKFLQKDMPALYSFLHYRIVDVSTIKELCKRWLPSLTAPPKMECHRALDDIKESILELKFYKEQIFDKIGQ